MDEEEIQNQLSSLLARIEQLEQKVEILEKAGLSVLAASGNSGSVGGGVTVSGDVLFEAIRTALTQIGEGDAATIRQQLLKNGQPNSLTRSDVNKALYAHKDVFTIDRQEGMKPVWKLLA